EAHAVEGARALVELGLAREAAWVRHHHECWDGSGYPDGLTGESIPLESRIIAGAERLEAMRSTRQYRRALTRAEAAARVELAAGTGLDPAGARVGVPLVEEGM